MKILIVGAGFAGVWAAASAARHREILGLSADELQITVVSPGHDLVIRPRLYERDPDSMRVALSRVFVPVDVDHVSGTVAEIDHSGHRVRVVSIAGKEEWLPYNQLIVASGSHLRWPASLPGAKFLKSVDTIAEAKALDAHLSSLPGTLDPDGRFTAVVVGAGFAGIEVATELIGRIKSVVELSGQSATSRVILVERADLVGPELGSGPRPFVQKAIEELGVEVALGRTVSTVSESGVTLDDGEFIAAQTVVWTAGMVSSELAQQLGAETDPLGRLPVDENLGVIGVPDVFAAGDTAAAWADEDHQVMQSCQHAIPQGKFAGHNAVAALFGQQSLPFRPTLYVTCVDLGDWGGVYTEGWDREVLLSGEDGKRRKMLINGKRIYPPVDDRAEILRQANPSLSARQATSTVS